MPVKACDAFKDTDFYHIWSTEASPRTLITNTADVLKAKT